MPDREYADEERIGFGPRMLLGAWALEPCRSSGCCGHDDCWTVAELRRLIDFAPAAVRVRPAY